MIQYNSTPWSRPGSRGGRTTESLLGRPWSRPRVFTHQQQGAVWCEVTPVETVSSPPRPFPAWNPIRRRTVAPPSPVTQ